MTMTNAQIYQFRVFVRGISPVIWRRVLLYETHTLADLHHTLQIVMNWSDDFMHQFLIRGQSYSIWRLGMDTNHHAAEVSLVSLRLHERERFLYEYNYFVWWQVEVRLEKILPHDKQRTYPYCQGGKRAGPPEDCDGPREYMHLRDHIYNPIHILVRVQELLMDQEEDENIREQLRDEFPDIRYWANAPLFDRKTCNVKLQQYADGDDSWRDFVV